MERVVEVVIRDHLATCGQRGICGAVQVDIAGGHFRQIDSMACHSAGGACCHSTLCRSLHLSRRHPEGDVPYSTVLLQKEVVMAPGENERHQEQL